MENIRQQTDICDCLVKELNKSVRILHCERFNETSNKWNTSCHEHSHVELLYFIKGDAYIVGDQEDSVVTANNLIIYPPHYWHQEHIDFHKHQEIICVGVQFRQDFEFKQVVTISDVDEKLQWLFVEMHSQFHESEWENLRHLNHLLFNYIRQSSRRGAVTTPPLPLRVQDYIRRHYKEKLTLGELSEHVSVSSSYLNRVFKADIGQTPIEFLNTVRIREAEKLLKQKQLTLDAISNEVGINDPKYFSKLFKSHNGISPREFRQRPN